MKKLVVTAFVILFTFTAVESAKKKSKKKNKTLSYKCDIILAEPGDLDPPGSFTLSKGKYQHTTSWTHPMSGETTKTVKKGKYKWKGNVLKLGKDFTYYGRKKDYYIFNEKKHADAYAKDSTTWDVMIKSNEIPASQGDVHYCYKI